MTLSSVEIILYVADQNSSRDFYASVLQRSPSLDVPGMTEFLLAPNVKLGLMPETGIVKIMQNKTPHPSSGNGIPRCELYLQTDDPARGVALAIQAGATEISPVQDRDWGDKVGYVSDLDGHVLAFAKRV